MPLKWKKENQLKVLNFDIENRPLAYLGPDYTTAEVTAIAAGWHHQKRIHCCVLGENSTGDHMQDYRDMLEWFLGLYNQADMVVGHYIRGHDLPVINHALMEVGLPHLSDKLTHDTKNDITKGKYLSMSQENLCEMLGIPASKYHMSNTRWREANRLLDSGFKETRRRAKGDVEQNKILHARLREMGVLGAPRVWRSGR